MKEMKRLIVTDRYAHFRFSSEYNAFNSLKTAYRRLEPDSISTLKEFDEDGDLIIEEPNKKTLIDEYVLEGITLERYPKDVLLLLDLDDNDNVMLTFYLLDQLPEE